METSRWNEEAVHPLTGEKRWFQAATEDESRARDRGVEGDGW